MINNIFSCGDSGEEERANAGDGGDLLDHSYRDQRQGGLHDVNGDGDDVLDDEAIYLITETSVKVVVIMMILMMMVMLIIMMMFLMMRPST